MTKKAILILSGFFAIFFVGLIYQRYYSSDAKVGFENRRNAKEISIGMSQAEVVKLMGNPKSVYCDENNSSEYYYPSDNIDNLDIEIKLDSLGNVINVIVPEYD